MSNHATNGTAQRASAIDSPNAVEVRWTGLLAEEGDSGCALVDAELLVRLALSGQGQASRLRAEFRRNGSGRVVLDDAVRVERRVHGRWLNLDVFHRDERILAVSVTNDEQPAYVHSQLPGLAQLQAGMLDPPTVACLRDTDGSGS